MNRKLRRFLFIWFLIALEKIINGYLYNCGLFEITNVKNIIIFDD